MNILLLFASLWRVGALLGVVLATVGGVVHAQVWIEGRVFDAKRKGIEGVKITRVATPREEFSMAPLMPSDKAVAISDSRGNYRLEARANTWWRFSKPGYATTLVRDPQGMAVMIPGRDVVGQVCDESGKPLAGVRLAAWMKYADLGANHGSQIVVARTGADGMFRLRSVPLSGVRVELRKDGYYDVQQALLPSAPLMLSMYKSGYARGSLMGPNGEALAAKVWIRYEASVLSLLGNRQYLSTQADGSYALSLRHRGRFRLFFTAPGHLSRTSDILAGPSDLAPVALREGKAQRVRVVDAKGVPIVGAVVGKCFRTIGGDCPHLSMERELFGSRSPVDKQGWVQLSLPLAMPKVSRVRQVQIWAPGFGTRRMEATLDPAVETLQPLNVTLLPELTLKGVVVDEAGRTISGVHIDHALSKGVENTRMWASRMQEPSWLVHSEVRTDNRGRFEISGLSAGHYKLINTHRFRPAGKPVEVQLAPGPAQARPVVRLVSPTGAILQGRLLGVPPNGAIRVGGSLSDIDDYRHALVPLDKGGRFTAAGLQRVGQPRWSHQLSRYKVQLILPRPQPSRSIPILVGEVQCKDAKVQREWRLESPGIAVVKGVIVQGVVPCHRLLVVLKMFGGRDQVQYSTVSEDGSFRLESAPVKYELSVVDWVTGIELFRERSLALKADEVRRHRISFRPRVVDVQLSPAHPGVEVPSVRLDFKPTLVQYFHTQLLWGQKLRLYLPSGSCHLSAALHTTNLLEENAGTVAPDVYRRILRPLGEITIPAAPKASPDSKPGPVPLIFLPVNAPAEIPKD